MGKENNKGLEKKLQVQTMFNSIAGKYDFLNHFLSARMDIRWRRKAVRILSAFKPASILDVATGTGDFAIAALESGAVKITGVDIAEEMLAMGREKLAKKKLSHIISLQSGDSEDLPFPDNTFDAVIVAFGVRNFGDLQKGLKEMHRVLTSRGVVVILEFSKPRRFPVKQIYGFYFRHILPRIGKIISGDASAYTYLPESVYRFPEGKEFLRILSECGFENTLQKKLSAGIASIYTGEKRLHVNKTK
ncbi:MAG: bifunctional demethylmenaquinone methyltransferase/2-methoxy-6-polyprenyl-1,4-benzoquinol methylase UbiE [Bacteroidales bacterium]|nr:bifunctional demethylmenaquinone methyltransferase/2-methoxy-6-polyprenyl-1,4-benzoquinol methylase UbiE [Bacteroidales bacterium]